MEFNKIINLLCQAHDEVPRFITNNTILTIQVNQ